MVELKRSSLAIGLACTVAAIAPAAAQAAGANVVTVVKQEEKFVDSSPDAKFFSHLKVKTKAEARADVPKIESFANAVRHAASVIASASADGAKQKQGQKDMVSAFHGIANALSSSASSLKDSGNGNGAGGLAESNKATRELQAAQKLGDKGQKLLGIPNS